MEPLKLLAVFAHPDDETFRCGGILTLLAQRGVCVQVLTATRGESGACGEPPLCTLAELPVVRERELRCACMALGIEPPRLLDYHDGQLAAADPDRLITQILDVVNEVRPQVLLTFGPDGLSGHPDHVAIGWCAMEAYRRAEGVAALYTPALPRSVAERLEMKQVQPVADEAIALSVDVSPVWEAKLAAIRCHATQLSTSPMMHASIERQRLFLGTEHFVQADVRRTALDFVPEILHQEVTLAVSVVKRPGSSKRRGGYECD
jgi:N-acetylglucosamine malate deacetylase 2